MDATEEPLRIDGRYAPRLRELDWLRGYGVALVGAVHVLDFLATDTAPMRWANERLFMQGGVDLFFALSGFVITGALERFWRGEVRDRPIELTAFWVRRVCRLWPALAFWAAFCVVASAVLPHHWPFHVAERMAAAAGYVANWREMHDTTGLGYFWSLALEWQFYLFLPVFLLWIRDDRLRLAILAAAFAGGLFWRPFGGDWWMFRVDALIAGIFVYYLRRVIRLGDTAPRSPMAAAPLVTALLIGGIVASISLFQWRYSFQLFVAVCSGALVFLASLERGYVSAFGAARFLDWLGSRSYSIYLCHIPVMICLWNVAEAALGRPLAFASDAPLMCVIAVGLIAAAGEVSFRWIERPSHRTARRVGRTIQEAAAAPQ